MAAPSFTLPPACTQGATGSYFGNGSDPLYGALPPTVSIVYLVRDQNVYVNDVVVQWVDGAWSYTFQPPSLFSTYLVIATYTPFLQSYAVPELKSSGPHTENLPPAGVSSNPQVRLLPSVYFQLMNPSTGQILPNGFLEMAADFPLSPPYTLQADANGIVVVNCYTSLPVGNPGTVSTSDGFWNYDAVFYATSTTDAEGRVQMEARAQ